MLRTYCKYRVQECKGGLLQGSIYRSLFQNLKYLVTLRACYDWPGYDETTLLHSMVYIKCWRSQLQYTCAHRGNFLEGTDHHSNEEYVSKRPNISAVQAKIVKGHYTHPVLSNICSREWFQKHDFRNPHSKIEPCGTPQNFPGMIHVIIVGSLNSKYLKCINFHWFCCFLANPRNVSLDFLSPVKILFHKFFWISPSMKISSCGFQATSQKQILIISSFVWNQTWGMWGSKMSSIFSNWEHFIPEIYFFQWSICEICEILLLWKFMPLR